MESKSKYKNELGNIYGSRVSKNGKWLNLLVITKINGEDVIITCPIRLENFADNADYGKKPYAQIGEKAAIFNVNVYTETKEESEEMGDIPELPF